MLVAPGDRVKFNKAPRKRILTGRVTHVRPEYLVIGVGLGRKTLERIYVVTPDRASQVIQRAAHEAAPSISEGNRDEEPNARTALQHGLRGGAQDELRLFDSDCQGQQRA